MYRVEEPFCQDGRPASLAVVIAGLNTLGAIWLGFAWRLLVLMGDEDVGGPFGAFVVLVVLAMVAGVGLAWFVLSWAYGRGYRRAWLATVLFTPPLLGLNWIPWDANPPFMIWASRLIALLVLLIQVAAWLPATRRAFWCRRILLEC